MPDNGQTKGLFNGAGNATCAAITTEIESETMATGCALSRHIFIGLQNV
jgi:hypothetical protein